MWKISYWELDFDNKEADGIVSFSQSANEISRKFKLIDDSKSIEFSYLEELEDGNTN